MASERLISRADAVFPLRAERPFYAIDNIETLPLNEEPPLVTETNHAFVVLGYALDSSGAMQDSLLGRLQVAKNAAEKNGDSKIIVSGGLSRGGNTEADVMAAWLEEQGLDPSRIIKEDQSDDTVENAVYSTSVMSQLGIASATLITSASHMRRALLLFWEADAQRRVSSHVVYRGLHEMDAGFSRDERLLTEVGLQRIVALHGLSRSRIIGAEALGMTRQNGGVVLQ